MKDLNSWYNTLQGTTAIGFDIETTNIAASKAMVYNMGVSVFAPDGTVNNKNMFMSGIINNPKNIEQSFLDAHTDILSKAFAQDQIDRGILNNYKAAIESGDLHTVDQGFQQFTNTIESIQGRKFILGQNMNFESQIFKELTRNTEGNLQGLDASTIKEYNRVTGRQDLKLSDSLLFSELQNINDLKVDLNPQLNTIKENIKNHGVASNITKKSLRDYSDNYTKVMDQYKSMMRSSSNTPIVDLMDITRALYARGALSGDLNTSYIDRAGSIDFISRALYGESEIHLGAEDNVFTKRIFDDFVKEYDEFSSNPTYKSPLLQKINKFVESENDIEKSYIKNIKNHIREAVSKQTDSPTLQKKLANSFMSYSHIERNQSIREDIYKTTIDMVKDSSIDSEKIMSYLDSISLTENTKDVVKPKPKNIEPKSGLSKKKIAVGVAGLVGLDMITSRQDNTSNYNTYDELYSNQYFGSDFSNWQERNGSHRLTY